MMRKQTGAEQTVARCAHLVAVLGTIVFWSSACVGEIEQTGAGMQDMSAPSSDSGLQDMGQRDLSTTPPLPMTGLAMTYSSFHEEVALSSGRSLDLEPGEELRGVVDVSQYALLVATNMGLYSVQEDGSRRELVAGELQALVHYDERSVLYLKEGEVYRFDGAQPEVVLGGLERREDPVTGLFRSGRDLWFFSRGATWHMHQDPLKGTHLERLEAFSPLPDALWGTLQATTYYYQSLDQPGLLFKVEQGASGGGLTIETVTGQGMDLVEAIYPLRGHRHLAIVRGLLAEQIDEQWWWRHPELEGTEERAKVEVLAHAHDPLTSASWLLTRPFGSGEPSDIALYRIESSWAVRAALPFEHVDQILKALDADTLRLHPQNTNSALFLSMGGARQTVLELEHEPMTRPALLDPPRGEVTYEEHVRPVAEIFCQECHTNGQGAAIFKIDGYQAWSDPIQFDIFLGSIERGSMPKEDEAVPPFSDELRGSFIESLKQWRDGGFKP